MSAIASGVTACASASAGANWRVSAVFRMHGPDREHLYTGSYPADRAGEEVSAAMRRVAAILRHFSRVGEADG
jgi:hypothetical protein